MGFMGFMSLNDILIYNILDFLKHDPDSFCEE